MNKKKVIAILLSLFFLASCGNDTDNIEKVKEDIIKETDIRVINTNPYLVKVYESIKELDKDSDFAIEGTVISNEYMKYDDLAYTISEVKVEKSLKGDILEGTTIKLLQSGGILDIINENLPKKDFEDKEEVERIREENKDEKYESVIYNAKVLKESEKCILYLEKIEGAFEKKFNPDFGDLQIGNDLYIATGNFQGRFKVDKENKVTPQSEYIKDCPKTASELELEIMVSNLELK